MKSMKIRVAAAVLVALSMTTAACGDDGETDDTGAGDTTTTAADAEGAVVIKSPESGVTAEGNTVTLELEASGVDIVKADGDTSGETGHFHVFIDTPPVAPGAAIPKGANIIHSADSSVLVSGLMPGDHKIVVVLGDGTHTRIGDDQDSIDVTVTGAGVQASIGGTPAAGQPISVNVKTEGVTLKGADGDTSGETGHVHLFVDREPTPAGQPIPTGDPKIIHSATSPVTVPALEAGEHTIWVVLGDGAHVPFDPQVMHKLTFTVT